MLGIELREVDAGAGGHIISPRFSRPVEEPRGGLAHMTCVADGGLAELPRVDVVRQRRDVMLGDVTRECFTKPRTEKPAQMARRVFQASSRGRISPSGLRTGVFIHAIRSSMISATVLPRRAFVAFWSRKVSVSASPPLALRP